MGQSIDVAFGCLPHGTSQDLIETLPAHVRVVDLSADYRLRDAELYAADLWPAASERRRARRRSNMACRNGAARELSGETLVACPGCYPTASLLALAADHSTVIDPDSVIIDAKSGVSGAGPRFERGQSVL